MPSMTAYSPYETLTLFQSIARYGADASTFQDISSALLQNDLVIRNGLTDDDRLSAEALRGLYDELVDLEKGHGTVKVNGDVSSGERSPKRRKLSPPLVQKHDRDEVYDQQLVQSLVEKLYVRYKEEAVREIKRDEDAYKKLQDEIRSLEFKVAADASKPQQPASVGNVGAQRLPKPEQAISAHTQISSDPTLAAVPNEKILKGNANQDLVRPDHRQQSPRLPSKSNIDLSHSVGPIPLPTGEPVRSQAATPAPQNTVTEAAPTSRNGQQSQRSPPQANNAPNQAKLGYQPSSHFAAQTTPHPHNAQQINGPARQSPVQNRNSPAPGPLQHAYPPYPPYPPQWHPQMGYPQYPQHPGYAQHYWPPPPVHGLPVQGLHPQTPQQVPYQHYPHTAPTQYGPPAAWRGQPHGPYPVSASNTPVPRPSSRVSVTRSGSTTPWRRRRESGIQRPSSPARPERAISPLLGDGTPPPETVKRIPPPDSSARTNKMEEETPTQQTRGRRRGRPPSKTPSAIVPSRSRSNASHDSDVAHDLTGRPRPKAKIKAEAPSTPLPPPSDTETQRSSGRRGRPRNSTITSQADAGRGNTTKRKRESPSPSPLPQSLTGIPVVTRNGVHGSMAISHDASLVIVSKSFSKTSQLLLNEITSHKLAGIFAKPLSERDAPGYKDLIQRPQDLKSIKAAISKGNRAALAAIEELDPDGEAVGGSSTHSASSGAVPGSLGNGFYLVTKTSDLMPPKGIVNSSQLEMELMRMFANAIMFNPLPSSESGFGRSLKLRRNGGDVDAKRARTAESQDGSDDDTVGSQESDTPATGGAGWDEGGIIADTREMFDDVKEAVNKWRGLEIERIGSSGHNIESSRTGSIATPSVAGGYLDVTGRHASVSASSNIADDEGDSTPVPATIRKRRRIAEH